jgi:hypothetical protein
VDGEEKPTSLFKLIKKTSEQKALELFQLMNVGCDFGEEEWWSLKAETHFPTTVEPFRPQLDLEGNS